MMKLKILIIIILFFNSMQIEKLQIDESKIALINFNPAYYWLFKNAKNTTLNNKNVQKIEKTLKSIVFTYNENRKNDLVIYKNKNPSCNLKLEQLTIDLSNYKRQYVAVINKKGEKEIWINMLCHDFSGKWQTEIVDVSDGGKCYFNFKINLSKNQYYDLMFNGES